MTEAKKLADLVQYQKDTIVSTQTIDKKAGSITVFAFSKGQGLSEHTAPYDAFVQVLDGTGEITIDGTAHAVNPGEFIVMPGGKPHSVKAGQDFKMLLVMIRSG